MSSLKENLQKLQDIELTIHDKGEISYDQEYSIGYDQGRLEGKLLSCQSNFIKNYTIMVKSRHPFCPYVEFVNALGGSNLIPILNVPSSQNTPALFSIKNPSKFYVSLYIEGSATFQPPGAGSYGVQDYYKIIKIPPEETYYGLFTSPLTGNVKQWSISIEGIFYSCQLEDQTVLKVTYNQNYGNNQSMTYYHNGVTQKTAPVPNQWIPTGRYFKGWNTKADGTGDWVSGSIYQAIPEDESIVYAIWGYSYTVTYRIKEGSTVTTTRTYTGDTSSINITLPTPESLGFTIVAAGAKSFYGWGHRPMGNISTVQPGTTFKLTSNKEFFGQWNY